MSKRRRSVDGFPSRALHFETIERPPELEGVVCALRVEPNNNIWISTIKDGVASIGMYDGAKWYAWRLSEPALIPRQFVLFQNMVIGQGMALHTVTNNQLVQLLPQHHFASLCNQHDRGLWAGTLLDGLFFSPDGVNWTSVPQPTPSDRASISALASAPDETILATEAGSALSGLQPVWRWVGDGWVPIAPPAYRNFRRVGKIMVRANGDIWTLSDEGGVWVWSDGAWFHEPDQGSNRIPAQTLVDIGFDEARDRAFITSTNYGLLMGRRGSWMRITSDADNSDRGNELYGKIYVDGTRLWIGSWLTDLCWISLDDLTDAEAAN